MPDVPPAERPADPALAQAAADATDWQRLAPVGVLGAIAVALPPLGGFALLGTMPWVAEWLREHPPTGLTLYVVGFVFFAGLALLPTYAQAILAGFAFGVPLGAPAALLGFTGASALAYAIARRASGDRLIEAVDTYPRLSLLRHTLLEGSFWRVLGMVTLLRVPPNSPFALSNLAFAGLKVPFLAFILGTLLGMTPRTVVAVVLGAGLSEFNLDDLSSNGTLIAGFAVTLVVVVIVTVIAKRVLDGMTAPDETPDP
ncbi:MAG: VTT domain-containing protein [Planctomycetota bacterium]